ncbi:cysteine-rich CWC family protein [Noviherbaspirillum pedocola]|uniref:Cysteine-rich CWC family protein n=1 Tax=Noviherbaspirillum pedocola TaxID=2801341 RepID=A0A934T0E5_9BURK|nr:cysteine-rich CWC family protein [Noviherbaspirillum pedocola]MBK4736457.1 cysteine-rich CWC family protein [Noviherbaspirillum pedocola]
MSTCIRCNASFRCGMVDSTEEPCWCAALLRLPAEALPQPEQPGCLCPDCLRAWLGERDASS